MQPNLTLWYEQPARQWVEALPVGNGRLGAMVVGGVTEERLQLNEDTLWSGGPRAANNPGARDVLPQVREAVLAGDYVRADALAKQMQGLFNQSYQPLGDLRLDPETHRVHRAGAELHLGPTEFRLLSALMEKPGRVWTREALLDRVWGRDIYVDTRTVDVHIGRLRKAIGVHGGDDLIRTVRGAGYSLD